MKVFDMVLIIWHAKRKIKVLTFFSVSSLVSTSNLTPSPDFNIEDSTPPLLQERGGGLY